MPEVDVAIQNVITILSLVIDSSSSRCVRITNVRSQDLAYLLPSRPGERYQGLVMEKDAPNHMNPDASPRIGSSSVFLLLAYLHWCFVVVALSLEEDRTKLLLIILDEPPQRPIDLLHGIPIDIVRSHGIEETVHASQCTGRVRDIVPMIIRQQFPACVARSNIDNRLKSCFCVCLRDNDVLIPDMEDGRSRDADRIESTSAHYRDVLLEVREKFEPIRSVKQGLDLLLRVDQRALPLRNAPIDSCVWIRILARKGFDIGREDNPKVWSSTSDGPVEIRMLSFRSSHHLSTRQDYPSGNDTIAAEPIVSYCPCYSASKSSSEPSETIACRTGDSPLGRGSVEGLVELFDPYPSLNRHNVAVLVDVNVVELPYIDQDTRRAKIERGGEAIPAVGDQKGCTVIMAKSYLESRQIGLSASTG